MFSVKARLPWSSRWDVVTFILCITWSAAAVGESGARSRGTSEPPPKITITDGRFVTGPDHQTVGAFTVINNDGASHLITGFSSPACAVLQLEQWDGSPPNAGSLELTVPGRGKLVFLRGGYHLHCQHPPQPLRIGTKVPVTITLRQLPDLRVLFDVGTPSPGGMVAQRRLP